MGQPLDLDELGVHPDKAAQVIYDLQRKLRRIGVLVDDYAAEHPYGRGLCNDIKAVLRG